MKTPFVISLSQFTPSFKCCPLLLGSSSKFLRFCLPTKISFVFVTSSYSWAFRSHAKCASGNRKLGKITGRFQMGQVFLWLWMVGEGDRLLGGKGRKGCLLSTQMGLHKRPLPLWTLFTLHYPSKFLLIVYQNWNKRNPVFKVKSASETPTNPFLKNSIAVRCFSSTPLVCRWSGWGSSHNFT